MPRSAAVRTASLTRSSMSMPMRHVQRGRRHVRAQRLDHRVAPDEQLRARPWAASTCGPGDTRGRRPCSRARRRRPPRLPPRRPAPFAGWWSPSCRAGRSSGRAPRRPRRGAPCPASRRSSGAAPRRRSTPCATDARRRAGCGRARRGTGGSCRRCPWWRPSWTRTACRGVRSCPACQFSASNGPSWTGRRVLHRDAGVFELVAHRVGGGPVLAAAGRGALLQCERDERVDHRASGLRIASDGPLRVERVEAEDVQHRPDPRECRRDRRRRRRRPARRCASRTTSCTTASAREVFRSSSMASTNASGTSPSSRRRPARRRGVTKPSIRRYAAAASRSASSRVVDHRAVVRREQVVAQLDRPEAGASTSDVRSMTLPSDLAIFEPPRFSSAWCTQNRANGMPGRLGLGDLVLVVREDQVEAAAVDVELGAEVAPAHGGALDVPAGPAGPPRRGPVGLGRLVGLGALPQREVARVALGPLGPVGRPAPSRRAAGRTARRTPRSERTSKYTSPLPSLAGYACPSVDQLLDQLVHLRDVAGRPRLVGRRQHAESRVVLGEHALVGVRERPRTARPASVDLGEHLVVDVGDVADERAPCSRSAATSGAARHSSPPERRWPMCGGACTVSPHR